MPTAVLEIHGERFAVIPESEYLHLLHEAGEEVPLPASLFDDDDVVDADEFVPRVIGQNLRLARMSVGLTQAQLAKKLNKSQALVSGAERGATEVGLRYWQSVLKICKLPKDWKPIIEKDPSH